MTKAKIWVIIIGTGLVASLATAATYFPEYRVLLVSLVGLISAGVATYTGINISQDS